MKMKRFLLFTFDDCYPGGGMNDLVGDFDTMAELMAYKNSSPSSDMYAHVLDTQNAIVITLDMPRLADGTCTWKNIGEDPLDSFKRWS